MTESHLAYNLIYSILLKYAFPSHLVKLIQLPWGFHHLYEIYVIFIVFGLMPILKKTSVTPEPLSAIHFSHIFSLQLFLWPFSCPLTPELNQLFVGYSFTLSEILDPFLLVSEVPAHVAEFDCYFINTFQLGGRGTSYSGVYGETPPEKGDFLSLQLSERLEKSLP